MDKETLRREVGKIAWFHRIDLGHGVVTPGGDDSSAKLKAIRMPETLHGRRVLDIGAWDGFFSFEAERRGASHVIAMDNYSAEMAAFDQRSGFHLAKRALNSRVEPVELDVYNLSSRRFGAFDLVLFLGVLYHLRDPLIALERIREVTSWLCILETHVDLLDCPHPAMLFYPGAELNNDKTNWWGPNTQCVSAMLRSAGFSRVEAIEPNPRYAGSRMIFHAYR
jgi:tRNA (mo5U34)-methyltransferase